MTQTVRERRLTRSQAKAGEEVQHMDLFSLPKKARKPRRKPLAKRENESPEKMGSPQKEETSLPSGSKNLESAGKENIAEKEFADQLDEEKPIRQFEAEEN